MAAFTGIWKLDTCKSSSQKSLMYALGRPMWQLLLADKTSETIEISHSAKLENDSTIHRFRKDVRINIDFMILNGLSFLSRIPYDKIEYSHIFVCDNEDVHFKNDCKNFGACSAKASRVNENVFTVEWHLIQGILVSKHTVCSDQLRIDIYFASYSGRNKVRTVKIYRKQPGQKS